MSDDPVFNIDDVEEGDPADEDEEEDAKETGAGEEETL